MIILFQVPAEMSNHREKKLDPSEKEKKKTNEQKAPPTNIVSTKANILEC